MSMADRRAGTSRHPGDVTAYHRHRPAGRGEAAADRGDAVMRRSEVVPHRSDLVPHRVDAVPLEARRFQGQRAGIVTRTAANVVDFWVVVGVLALGYAAWCGARLLTNPRGFAFPTPSFMVLLGCFAVVLLSYFTVCWATTGRTYGDHLLGLRVVSFRGERLRWPAAVVRAGFCLLLPLGLYWAVISPTNRSVQDSVLRTSVLYDWTTRRPGRTGVEQDRG